jgi:hypothetical protein
MELSPQDRERIFLEEKARREAQEKLKKENNAKNTKYGCIGCVGLLVLLAIIGALIPKSKKSRDDTRTTMAYIMAKQFIQKQLKAPGSAEFPSQVWNEGEVRIVKLGDGSYRIRAWVDAQNAFGAKLRKNWTCDLKEASTDHWEGRVFAVFSNRGHQNANSCVVSALGRPIRVRPRPRFAGGGRLKRG